ncbi:MAG: 3-hydroxyacyl-ACP dehydratase FabZ [Labilithrix sp.]|nr:3-hydroxyacyl-ACP dehydratase FabZ [Labilithrix sp.]MCW5812733.1 3-hydroxyacyl-ACP dehydratase FabZ [Labilithrix sp.]
MSVLSQLPHRAPFRLVDEVTFADGERIEGYRDVRADEPWFAGHFPDNPLLPGVLVIESLAQLGGLLGGAASIRLVAIDKAKLRRPVVPGERLLLSAVLLQRHGGAIKVRAEAKVGESRVAEAELLLAVP